MKLTKGMVVKVISGSSKGKEGKIIKVYPKSGKVLVEGVNFKKKATRPTQENQSGGFVEKEYPINSSKLLLKYEGTTTRIKYKILDNGKKIRVTQKNDKEIII